METTIEEWFHSHNSLDFQSHESIEIIQKARHLLFKDIYTKTVEKGKQQTNRK